MEKIKIGIADDHLLFRKGIGSILEKNDGLEIVFDAENGKVLIDKLATIPTDVILVDLDMPVLSGGQAIEIIKVKYPKVKILALTLHDHEVIIANIIGKGANGFMLKDDSIEAVIEAIFTVFEKDFYFTPRVQKAIEKIAEKALKKPIEKGIDFSIRELEILKLICHENSTREIACKLNTSIRTVEWHKQNMIEKTNTKTTAGIVFYAVKNGLVV
ncbi:MAG TPA: response regulator transcription factor [Bacteroidia bacterium]|nr:response regulator transcription factor [Bacteroidia bacterium]HRH08797.1 response regulator transcription factor [Bacteroidia bacterium]